MGLRDNINKNPAIGFAIAALGLVLAVALIIWTLSGSSDPVAPNQEYYTVDDGQTWFAAPKNSYAPFEHEGKTAVRAAVFECDGEQFVGYLERYKAEFHEQLVAATADGGTPSQGLVQAAAISGLEIKKPGEDAWFGKENGDEFGRIQTVRCPEGGLARPVFAD